MWIIQMIMESEIMGQVSYAPDGINEIRKLFIVAPVIPKYLQIPQQLLHFFHVSKERFPLAETITSRYNITQLIDSVIEDVRQLNPSVFSMQGSGLNIVLCVLNMMQMKQLSKAIDSRQVKDSPIEISDLLLKRLDRAKGDCATMGAKIQEIKCPMISPNTHKSRDILILRLKDINQDSRVLNSPLMEQDLHCVFSNILLNIRRTIRGRLISMQPQLHNYLRALKLLQAKSYYLSVATFTLTETYVRQLAHDVFNNERKITYVHLLHEEQGLSKIHRYFQDAPISQLDKDMDLLSERFNQRLRNNRKQNAP